MKLTVPIIGNCASAHINAKISNTQRVATRLTMKPTTMAAIENSKKNDEPSKPNCCGLEFQLGHDRHAGETDHDLVGEIHQHEEKQEKRYLPGAFGCWLRSHDRPQWMSVGLGDRPDPMLHIG